MDRSEFVSAISNLGYEPSPNCFGQIWIHRKFKDLKVSVDTLDDVMPVFGITAHQTMYNFLEEEIFYCNLMSGGLKLSRDQCAWMKYAIDKHRRNRQK